MTKENDKPSNEEDGIDLVHWDVTRVTKKNGVGVVALAAETHAAHSLLFIPGLSVGVALHHIAKHNMALQ